ncbi:MAG: prepilin peptidase [Minisyncoccia bacterium]
MTLVILFVLGTIVGSFLNVIGLRWDSKNFGGRSACPNCAKTLSWHELIPVLSFFLLKRKCSGCQAPISWQYPIIEIWTGLIFASLFYIIDPLNLLSFLNYLVLVAVFSLYIVITIYDIRHKIIPDTLVYTCILLALGYRMYSYFSLPTPYFLDLLAGPIIFVFFGSIWLFSRGRAMGFGDAKLGLSVGLLLGAAKGFSAIIFAFWLGALAALILFFVVKLGLPAQAGFIKSDKGLTMKSEVPFGPAIVLGAWLALFFHLNFNHVLPI